MTISLRNTFQEPPVIVLLPMGSGSPAAVRIKDVTVSSFQALVVAWMGQRRGVTSLVGHL